MSDRYARQIMLPEIGEKGQAALFHSKAAVAGAGGLGSSVLYGLAAAGVGQIKIIDPDVVEITNLNRQFIHGEADLGRKKSISALEKIHGFNSEVTVTSCPVSVTAENADDLIAGCDTVISCVDNRKPRLLLNDRCVKRNIPLTDGGINGFDGYVFTVLPGSNHCLRCVFPEGGESPETAGAVGAAAGVIGSMMALQAIKTLLGIGMDAPLYYVDLMSFRVLPVRAGQKPNCPVCGKKTRTGTGPSSL